MPGLCGAVVETVVDGGEAPVAPKEGNVAWSQASCSGENGAGEAITVLAAARHVALRLTGSMADLEPGLGERLTSVSDRLEA